MNRGAIVLVVMTIIGVECSFGQDSAAITRCQPFGDPLSSVLEIMRGVPYSSIKQYIAPDSYVIIGRTRQPLVTVLQRKDRAAILDCDSTRTGWVQYTSNISEDALCFTIEAIGVTDGETHYHSLVLYKKPTVGWQISLWHVGL
jgi:hypothetical protein